MAKQVREIIVANMTVVRFLYSKNIAEAYFQSVCYAASSLAIFDERERYHPYSFHKMKDFLLNT